MTPTIEADRVTKHFRFYEKPAGRLYEWLSGGRLRCHEKVVALQDVSLSVAPGEALGVVGLNGSGKTTLLRILAGIMPPSSGTVTGPASVSEVIELGLSFRDILSGRENCDLALSINGVPREARSELVEWALEFTELGAYFERPLRTYSTGMRMRLAFAVATAIRPELLLVDEALAVGDIAFQQKALERIHRFLSDGTALVFASHDHGMVKSLCSQALLLDHGRPVFLGASEDVVNAYHARAHSPPATKTSDDEAGDGPPTSTGRWGNRAAEIESTALLQDGVETDRVISGRPMELRMTIHVRADVRKLVAGLLVRDRLGRDVLGHNAAVPLAEDRTDVRREVRFHFPDPALGIGSYSVSVAVHEEQWGGTYYDWHDRRLPFDVVDVPEGRTAGLAALPVRVEAE